MTERKEPDRRPKWPRKMLDEKREAQARMTKGIANALGGRPLDEIVAGLGGSKGLVNTVGVDEEE